MMTGDQDLDAECQPITTIGIFPISKHTIILAKD